MSKHNYQRITLPIKGMHCRSCEILLEREIAKIKNVIKCETDYRQGVAEIYYKYNAPEIQELEDAVMSAGYEIGEADKEKFFSRNILDYQELVWAIVVVLIGYEILKYFDIAGINFDADSSKLSFGMVVVVGLVAGFSSCMALIGGLVLSLSTKHAEKHPEATTIEKFRPHLYFNLGRIVCYAFFGGILGMIGSVFQLSIFLTGLLTIFASIVMLFVGLQLIKIFPWFNSIKITLPKGLAKMIGADRHHLEYNHKNSVIVGALTFFLPCGFTQAMQIYAISTGSFFRGALIMGLFAFGTAFGLLSVGGLTSLFKGLMARRLFKIAGVVVIAFALFNFSNSLSLMGVDFKSDSKTTEAKKVVEKQDESIVVVDGIQTVNIIEGRSGYTPRIVNIKNNVPVKLIIDAQAPYSCAASFVIPSLGIRKNLVAGENIIEFTPTGVDRINFSCSMGMYTGYFNVVD
jgi:sulfite exporter TauE/SafE/copper chaperone CopZ